MGWFTSLSAHPSPRIEGARITLRLPVNADFAAWARLREGSRDFLTPYEPSWAPDDLDFRAFLARVRHHETEARQGTALGFLLERRADAALIGGITLSNIRRGVAQTGSLGYWMGKDYLRQGYMSEAVGLVIGHAFGTMRLHRIEAACLIDNAASQGLLEKAGFQREGYARRYLNINGMWRDHLLFALLGDDRQA